MRTDDIVRAWRDQEYFLGLSAAQRASLPANPAGLVELSPDALSNVLGASHSTCFVSCHPRSSECCNSCFSGGTLCCC